MFTVNVPPKISIYIRPDYSTTLLIEILNYFYLHFSVQKLRAFSTSHTVQKEPSTIWSRTRSFSKLTIPSRLLAHKKSLILRTCPFRTVLATDVASKSVYDTRGSEKNVVKKTNYLVC